MKTVWLDSELCEYASDRADIESKEGNFERSNMSEMASSCRRAVYVVRKKACRVKEVFDWRHSCLIKGHGSTVWSPKRTTLLAMAIVETGSEKGAESLDHLQDCFGPALEYITLEAVT